MLWVNTKTITKSFLGAKKRALGIRKRAPKLYRKTTVFLQRHPFRSFFLALGLLFGLIVLGNVLGRLNKEETKVPEIVKEVKIYQMTDTPKLNLQAKIEATGAVKIFAQSPGVVQTIMKKEGDAVGKGTAIVYLSTTYQGGNAAALQQSLATRQHKNTEETYDAQKELIEKQREVANKTSDNASDLRNISQRSADDTKGLLSINEDILSTVEYTLETLEVNNPGGINDALIAQTKQQRAQISSGVVQLRAGLRNLEYQAASDKPPADLTNLQKDIAIKQLDIQQKALDLGRDVSRIQLQLAGVNAQLMCPASPFVGRVEKIHVRVGQAVLPGTLIATITGTKNTVIATVLVPRTLATAVSQVEMSKLLINGTEQAVTPTYVSQSPTDGQLYTVLYNIPKNVASLVTDGEFLPIVVPVGIGKTNGQIPYIPIDAVYQTEEEAYVNVVSGDKAVNKRVKLGDVYGRYVAVVSGIGSGDKVIINRNVIAGEKVRVK